MNQRIKNFSKDDSMRTVRIGIIIGLGVLCTWFTYMGVTWDIANPNMPIELYAMSLFGTAVTLSLILISVFIEEDKRPEAEYIQ